MENTSQIFFDTERFILEVKERRCIWDPSMKEYKDKKMEAWMDIAPNVFTDYEIMNDKEKENAVASLKKRWKHLRDCYSREERTRRKKQNPLNKSRKIYAYYDLMRFLKTANSNNTENESGRESEEEVRKPSLQEILSRRKTEFKIARQQPESESQEIHSNSVDANSYEKNPSVQEHKELVPLPKRCWTKPGSSKQLSASGSNENLSIMKYYSSPKLQSKHEIETEKIDQSSAASVYSTSWESVPSPEPASEVRFGKLVSRTDWEVESSEEPTSNLNLVRNSTAGIRTEETIFQEYNLPPNSVDCHIKLEIESDVEFDDGSNQLTILGLPSAAFNTAPESESLGTRKQTPNTSICAIAGNYNDIQFAEQQNQEANCTNGSTRESRKRKRYEQQHNNFYQILQEAFLANMSEKQRDLDADELFFRSLMVEFKQIPKTRKVEAKCSLIKLIEEFKANPIP